MLLVDFETMTCKHLANELGFMQDYWNGACKLKIIALSNIDILMKPNNLTLIDFDSYYDMVLNKVIHKLEKIDKKVFYIEDILTYIKDMILVNHNCIRFINNNNNFNQLFIVDINDLDSSIHAFVQEYLSVLYLYGFFEKKEVTHEQ